MKMFALHTVFKSGQILQEILSGLLMTVTAGIAADAKPFVQPRNPAGCQCPRKHIWHGAKRQTREAHPEELLPVSIDIVCLIIWNVWGLNMMKHLVQGMIL